MRSLILHIDADALQDVQWEVLGGCLALLRPCQNMIQLGAFCTGENIYAYTYDEFKPWLVHVSEVCLTIPFYPSIVDVPYGTFEYNNNQHRRTGAHVTRRECWYLSRP
eukprot:jgi/Botrbrau1/6903/Bobra.67_3s0022.1